VIRRYFTVTTVALLVFSAQFARAEEMQPGQYASTNVVEMANGQNRAFQLQECVTAKDIADGMTKVGIESDGDCKVQDLVKGNGKITYRLICEEDGKKQLAEVVGTYTANSYEFAIKATSPGSGYKSIRATGKRLGACK
jgi:hypothetical protein